VPDMGDLAGFSFPAIGCPPHLPVMFVSYGITGIPKVRSNSRVGWVLDHRSQLPVSDLPSNLRPELKIDSLVIDRPAPIGAQEQPFIGVSDHLLQGPLSRFQIDIGHADQGDAIPTIGSHRAIAFSMEMTRCLSRREEIHEDPL